MTQWGGTSSTHTYPAQKEKREAEKRLPGEGTQTAHSAVRCDGTVDGVTGEQDVDQQSHCAGEGVAEKSAVHDGQSSCEPKHSVTRRTSNCTAHII